MINYKVLKALEDVDKLIKDEIRGDTAPFDNVKDILRDARVKIQQAITIILKGA